MKLTSTRMEYTYSVADESGYKFDIIATKDDEWGWHASVSFNTFGFKTPEAAVDHLHHAVSHCLRLMSEETDAEIQEP